MKQLTKESILKVIETINSDRMNGLFKKLNKAKRKKDSWEIEYYSKRINEFKKQSTAIKYMPRLNVFKESNGNLLFNPESMVAYSYKWYELAKVINGKMVLNSYRYSSTTSKHIWSMRSLLSQLGIKHIEIEAPNGLQDMESALTYTVDQFGRQFVENLYSRNPIKNFRKSQAFKAIDLVQKLRGKNETKAVELLITSSVHKYENLRTQRLAKKRYERDQKKQIDNIVETPSLDLTGTFPKLELISGGAA